MNITGAVGVGLVCYKRKAWQPMALEVAWAGVGVSALASSMLSRSQTPSHQQKEPSEETPP